jgi:hypothetical protein
MQSGKMITLSVWLMIFFNLLLGAGAVWSFQRMSPEIRQIFERHAVTLEACENMFLALSGEKPDLPGFRKALGEAERNVTEKNSQELLQRIRENLDGLEKNAPEARKKIAQEISKLSFDNRQAVSASAEETQQMRRAGAWGVVFMTFFFFIAALFFEQRLRRTFLMPVEEMVSVFEARRQGDKFRRCNGADASRDMKDLFKSVNALLDSCGREKEQGE